LLERKLPNILIAILVRDDQEKLTGSVHDFARYIERQIDNLVYELYGLTEDEIKIVEGD
jgi:hypothetical protein